MPPLSIDVQLEHICSFANAEYMNEKHLRVGFDDVLALRRAGHGPCSTTPVHLLATRKTVGENTGK